MILHSLRWRFVGLFVVFMSASMTLLAHRLFEHEHAALLQELRKHLAVEATNLAIQAREALETGDELGVLTSLRARRDLEDFGFAAVLQPDGTVFAHSDLRQIGHRLAMPVGVRTLAHDLTFRETGTLVEVWAPVISTLGSTPQRIGAVVLAVSQHAVLAAIRDARQAAIRIGGAFVLLGIAGTALIAGTVTRPITRLVEGVRRIAAGDLEHKMQLRRSDEIGLLADAFDNMTLELQAAQKKIVEQRLYEHELQVAGAIQAALLPERPPHVPGCEVAALSVPARMVGGDLYDFIELPGARYALLVADVAGKGVSAGLGMTAIRSAARSAFTHTASPRAAFIALNEQVQRDFDRRTFVTMLALVVDPAGPSVEIVNAGHPSVVHYRARARTAAAVRQRGAALGVLPTPQFAGLIQPHRLALEPGDLVLGYSDGVNEAHNGNGELFGEGRVLTFTREHAGRECTAFLDALRDTLQAFAADAGQFDDITALALRALPVPSRVHAPQHQETTS